jgi:energy-coupling factor transporter ATP-binding protein EcfA2
MATHDVSMVNLMRRRVVELDHGRIVRDQARGVYGYASELSNTTSRGVPAVPVLDEPESDESLEVESVTSRFTAERTRRGDR